MTHPFDDSRTATIARPHEPASPAHGWIRRIACISTSRADAGIYAPLLKALSDAGEFQIDCMAGGTHPCDSFGQTGRQFDALPHVRVTSIQHQVAGDEPRQIADTAGRGILAYSGAIADARPDLIFVLGDRTEMLAAALAAMIHKIPIAHLHGGDITEGAYDDQCRHAMTKLAHVHFPALPEHARRIEAMGEESWRVHPTGALALDDLARFTPIDRAELSRLVGVDFSSPTAVVLFHPETLAEETPAAQVNEVAAAVQSLRMNLLVIDPNADAGRQAIADAWRSLATSRPGVAIAASLSQRAFWSCLAHARVLIGNSSAGIIEAPSMQTPVVNIGDRQAGRVRAANVLDTHVQRNAIAHAIAGAIEPAFRQSLSESANPYGDGQAAERIIRAIRNLPARQVVLRKKWVISERL